MLLSWDMLIFFSCCTTPLDLTAALLSPPGQILLDCDPSAPEPPGGLRPFPDTRVEVCERSCCGHARQHAAGRPRLRSPHPESGAPSPPPTGVAWPVAAAVWKFRRGGVIINSEIAVDGNAPRRLLCLTSLSPSACASRGERERGGRKPLGRDPAVLCEGTRSHCGKSCAPARRTEVAP